MLKSKLFSFLRSTGRTDGDMQTTAHGIDPANDDTVRHCPKCGSGSLWGRQDGTIACEYCELVFQVQIQPQYPNSVQNINGAAIGPDGLPTGEQIPGVPLGAPQSPQDGVEGEPGMEADTEPLEGAEPPGEPEPGSPADEENPPEGDLDGNVMQTQSVLQSQALRSGWPKGDALVKHLAAPSASGGHGWDQQRIDNLPDISERRRGSRVWRHEAAHGVLPIDDPMFVKPIDPGHEHWSADDVDGQTVSGWPGRYADTDTGMETEGKLFFGADSNVLSRDDMLRFIALRHANNRHAVLEVIRGENGIV